LKSRLLVTLVSALADHPSASEAIAACVPERSHAAYERALARLAASEVIDAC
jgi:putative mycofactocin binding protein MftB